VEARVEKTEAAPHRSPAQQVRVPGLPAAPLVSTSENEVGDMLADMMRARLALMPPQVAEDYRDLARRDDLTVAEKAKVNVLEDTYSPSKQQIQAAMSEVQADREAKSKGSLAADSRHRVGSSRT
jgi:hypothetical protein